MCFIPIQLFGNIKERKFKILPKIINETRFVENNIFEYEKRLQSPLNRFIDKSPTLVTYYHINNDETTVDGGFEDIEAYIGDNSPIVFNKITDFPIYGLQQINPQIIEDDQGIDVNYEAEAYILPHTIKPFQNDAFVINVLNEHDTYIFRVTSIEYDNIHPDNYYKIDFKLESVDPFTLERLEEQCIDTYVCVLDNIGTEDNCILKTDLYDKYKRLQDIYEDLSNTYINIFYNERYNTLLGSKECAEKVYDPYLIHFVNNWGLFNKKNELTTYIFSQELQDTRFRFKYEKSIYRFIERHDIRLINNFRYYTYKGVDLRYSSFSLWNDESINILEIPTDYYDDKTSLIFTDEFLDIIRNNKPIESDYGKVLKAYILGKVEIKDIPDSLPDALYSLNANMEFFFITPILLYIIREVLGRSMKNKILNTTNIN
jgi:hypothetical protein